ARSSQGLANGHLASTRAAAREQKIGDVDAPDEQNHDDGGEKQNQRLTDAANQSFFQRDEPHGPGVLRRIVDGIFVLERADQRVDATLRSGERDSRRDSRDRSRKDSWASKRRRSRRCAETRGQP